MEYKAGMLNPIADFELKNKSQRSISDLNL